MFWYSIIQLIYLLDCIYRYFPVNGFNSYCASSAALFSILMFECVNYIEHYGLVKKKIRIWKV